MLQKLNATTPDEIRDTWEALGQSEAFEAFDSGGVTYGQVEAVLGKGVAEAYATWTYYANK
jgi:hypothetical protein